MKSFRKSGIAALVAVLLIGAACALVPRLLAAQTKLEESKAEYAASVNALAVETIASFSEEAEETPQVSEELAEVIEELKADPVPSNAAPVFEVSADELLAATTEVESSKNALDAEAVKLRTAVIGYHDLKSQYWLSKDAYGKHMDDVRIGLLSVSQAQSALRAAMQAECETLESDVGPADSDIEAAKLILAGAGPEKKDGQFAKPPASITELQQTLAELEGALAEKREALRAEAERMARLAQDLARAELRVRFSVQRHKELSVTYAGTQARLGELRKVEHEYRKLFPGLQTVAIDNSLPEATETEQAK